MVFVSPTVTLQNGKTIPQLGFGTWQAPDEEVKKAVEVALKAGYRHLDLAKVYQNQKAIGPAIASAGVSRSDLFITSKLWNSSHKPENVEPALDDTLKELGLEYLDLYLIHWPVAFEEEGDPTVNLFPKENDSCKIDAKTSIVDTWKAMVKLLDTGKVKSIGVSNFNAEMIDAITEATGVQPQVNQIERHPKLLQPEFLDYLKKKNIHVTAYSGFGNNTVGEPLLITHPTVKKLAEQYNTGVGNILISWGVSGGHSIIPKSVTPSRIESNFQLVDLKAEDVEAINAIGDVSKGGEKKRFNVPMTYSPQWSINVFGEDSEKDAKYKVNLGK
ncbi:hypothetical protein JCM10213_003972 [Rhodosporidiobolus nylandii]